MKENFETLWARYDRIIYNFFKGAVHQSADAEDLLQTVACKAFAAHPDLRSDEAFFSWIFSIAKRTLVDYYRSRVPEPVAITDKVALRGLITPHLASASLTEIVVSDFIDGLSEPWASALYLHLHHGLKPKELAELIHKKPDTVSKHLNRLKEQLQALLSRSEQK